MDASDARSTAALPRYLAGTVSSGAKIRSSALPAAAGAINQNGEISHPPTVHMPLGGGVQASAGPVLSPLVESPPDDTPAAMGDLVPINDSATVRINNARQEVSSCIEGYWCIRTCCTGTKATAASDGDDSALIISDSTLGRPFWTPSPTTTRMVRRLGRNLGNAEVAPPTIIELENFVATTLENIRILEDNIRMLEVSGGLGQNQIDRLPTTMVPLDADIPGSSTGAAHHSTAEVKCSICQDRFEELEILRVIPCVHQYHKMCIDQWVMRNASCRVCRIKITVNNRSN